MPLRRAPWERQLAAEAFTLGENAGTRFLGKLAPRPGDSEWLAGGGLVPAGWVGLCQLGA